MDVVAFEGERMRGKKKNRGLRKREKSTDPVEEGETETLQRKRSNARQRKI